jgi:hypothetical protein
MASAATGDVQLRAAVLLAEFKQRSMVTTDSTHQTWCLMFEAGLCTNSAVHN